MDTNATTQKRKEGGRPRPLNVAGVEYLLAVGSPTAHGHGGRATSHLVAGGS
jgi:hypothetical protein